MHPKIEHRDLIHPNPLVFMGKLSIWAGGILLGIVLAALPSWWSQTIGVALVALMFAHGIELEHQALHCTGTGKRRLDMALGFILGLPLLISVSHYQDRHLHHHQHVGTPDDSEFFQFSKDDNNRPIRFIGNLLMIPHWRRVAQLVWASWTGGDIGRVYNANNAKRIRRDYAALGLAVVLAAALVAIFHPFKLVLLLAFPVAACLHTLLELPEHWKCNKVPSVLENTRTVRAGRLATWFTNGNNYHVEHHLAPALRPEMLPTFHARISSRIVHHNDSYLDLIREAFKGKVSHELR